MILIAAITSACAMFIGVYTLATPSRPKEVTSRLGRFDRTNTNDREARLAEPFTTRVGGLVVGKIQGVAARFLPGSILRAVEARLIQAGEPLSLHAFLAVEMAAASASALVLIFGFSSGTSGIGVLLVLAAALIVAVAPLYWLRLRVLARRGAILKALPDAVDLVVTTVEAGLAIDAALAEVGHETRGPLGEELRLTVRETTLGRSRRDALQRLIDRTQVQELRTFVQSIIQAEQTGIPVGQVLRTQAQQIRVQRRQKAEAAAQRAPVKMVLVLVLLVLPTMLAMVMGPALMRMNDSNVF